MSLSFQPFPGKQLSFLFSDRKIKEQRKKKWKNKAKQTTQRTYPKSPSLYKIKQGPEFRASLLALLLPVS